MRHGNAVVILALAAAAVGAGNARAHKLDVEYRVLPGKTVRVEGWYESGESPKNALVQVTRENGEVVAQGTLNSQGLFLFTFAEAEPLKVVVDTRDHRKEIRIPVEALRAGEAAPSAAVAAAPPSEPPLARRESPGAARDVMAGVALVLAVAALLLSWRNARRLQELTDRGAKG